MIWGAMIGALSGALGASVLAGRDADGSAHETRNALIGAAGGIVAILLFGPTIIETAAGRGLGPLPIMFFISVGCLFGAVFFLMSQTIYKQLKK